MKLSEAFTEIFSLEIYSNLISNLILMIGNVVFLLFSETIYVLQRGRKNI